MSRDFEDYITNLNELEDVMLGDHIGNGAYRDVYAMKQDPLKVVKVANCVEGRRENMFESKIYEDVIGSRYEKHFAKVFEISSGGKYLIMERIERRPEKCYPKVIPSFFTDVKYENYGWNSKGQFVCLDYSLTDTVKGMNGRTKKAEWK